MINPYDEPIGDSEKENMTKLWMDECDMFVPFNVYKPKDEKEIGMMFGCSVIWNGEGNYSAYGELK